ncbi:MAG: ATP-binding protein [Desulfobacterales bacterium]|nr:ATP-binding protein [Desulfobacterales bacterium]
MSRVEEDLKRFFTDFEGRFDAQLGRVSLSQTAVDERLGTSSPYLCQVKARYDRELLRLLDDGMLLAVSNFRSRPDGTRYTLLEVIRFWPVHFGLSAVRDYQYYPLQFEVIEQSVEDWETDDKATMMIQLACIPVNYDLYFDGGEPSFERGFSYPVVGSRAYILSRDLIREMYNRSVLERQGWALEGTCADARVDPRLGTVKMFEAAGEEIPFYIDFDALVRYHFGIFAFTGGGKSNMMSNILRRLLIHNSEVKVVIFDISCEYPFLLMDIFADEAVPSRVIMENMPRTVEDFCNSVVKPRYYEDDPRVTQGLGAVHELGRVSHMRRARLQVPQFAEFLSDIERLKDSNLDHPNYVEALRDVEEVVLGYMEDHELREDDELTRQVVTMIVDRAQEVVEEYKVHPMSALCGWFIARDKMMGYFDLEPRQGGEGYSTEDVEELLKGDTRLVSLSISEPTTLKRLVIDLTHDILLNRKREFSVRPYILFVWDEAQEFVSAPSSLRGIDKTCSEEVEKLLRQGRKYGLGGCIATQRIAYLNTNALQQLHTYFVSTLPRPYDRGLISNTFMIDKTILEKTLEFVPGEWLVSSYLATGMANVPIFVKADNAENEIEKYLKTLP